MSKPNTTTERPACRLCGGTHGQLNATGAHELCAARAEHGIPTPCLGHPCPTCDGRGRIPVSAAGPTNPTQAAIDAWAPRCDSCGGSGRTDYSSADAAEMGAGVERARALGAALAGLVAPLFPRRRSSSVRQRLDEIHIDGRDDQEADVIMEDDGRIGVRAVVRVMLPAGADAAAVIAELRRLGVL